MHCTHGGGSQHSMHIMPQNKFSPTVFFCVFSTYFHFVPGLLFATGSHLNMKKSATNTAVLKLFNKSRCMQNYFVINHLNGYPGLINFYADVYCIPLLTQATPTFRQQQNPTATHNCDPLTIEYLLGRMLGFLLVESKKKLSWSVFRYIEKAHKRK